LTLLTDCQVILFGLLHGLGSASAPSDVGLPQHNIPMALFLFNVGAELGQLSFCGAHVTACYSY